MQIDQVMIDEMVEQAIAECAEQFYAGDIRRMRQDLMRGHCARCKCVFESLVKHLSLYLGQVDHTVKAVYQYAPIDIPQKLNPKQAKGHAGTNLVAWVSRKSAALNALIETLEMVLSTSQRRIGCISANSACYTLDVTLVDDKDVQERRGLGLLVPYNRLQSKLVWERSDQPLQLPENEEVETARVTFSLPDFFDLDLIPEARLLEHAAAIEQASPDDRSALEHHLTELKVTLIRRIISDQLAYINIAKKWLTVANLADIYKHRIGFGKIGGKAAGLLLAERIIQEVADDELKSSIHVPESYFIGSDMMHIFMAMNGMMHWSDQKYKHEDQIHSEFPRICEEFQAGEFPPEVLTELNTLLDAIGPCPLIVRSSSQLEDNFGTSFAGKYDSNFCPNQGTAEENLKALTRAIALTYASMFKPDALLYRRSRGLQDYDERMAVLIQPVQGEKWQKYYFPFGAGVAFSTNMYRWAPQIRREDGVARLVWGLGTRAVDRVGNDYPRLIALSHPTLQPDDTPQSIRYYSQQFIDLIDLEENTLKTLPIHKVLAPNYTSIRYLIQLEQDDYFSTPRSRILRDDIPNTAITYNDFLQRTPFASLLSRMINLLEEYWHSPVDVEFTTRVCDPLPSPAQVEISLLQCRAQSRLEITKTAMLPEDIPPEDIIFSSHFIVPQGYLTKIRYVLFIPPANYFSLPTVNARNELRRLIAQLNAKLAHKTFICVGPGRWGTTNIDLGVYVEYADICNAGALIELSGKEVGPAPEPSLGTHFFQDLMEAQIYPVAVPLDDPATDFNRRFFYNSKNCVKDWITLRKEQADCLHLIDVAAFRPAHHITIVMDDEQGQALAFLDPDGK